MNETEQTTIREIVADDFRTAAVFQKFGLDFCCGGGKTIDDACRERDLDPRVVLGELDKVHTAPSNGTPKFNAWDTAFLIDYIVHNHHRYVREAIPIILGHTRKVATVHGGRHPETIRVAEGFAQTARDLEMHMRKEEEVLFPHIKRLVQAEREGERIGLPPFGSVRNPIRMMEAEHVVAGDEMAEIRSLTNGYTPPADACMTYRVSYQELEQFEDDLHRHVHLENNILFPKAVELELRLG